MPRNAEDRQNAGRSGGTDARCQRQLLTFFKVHVLPTPGFVQLLQQSMRMVANPSLMREMTRTAHTHGEARWAKRERSYVATPGMQIAPWASSTPCRAVTTRWPGACAADTLSRCCFFGHRCELTRSLRTRSLRPCQEAGDRHRSFEWRLPDLHVAHPYTCIILHTSPLCSFQEAAPPAAGTRRRGELSTSEYLQQPLSC